MMALGWIRKRLRFNQPAGTSRGVLDEKPSWYLVARDSASQRIIGIGECGPIPGLSIDDLSQLEGTLDDICRSGTTASAVDISTYQGFPSIQFGLESLHRDLLEDGDGILFPSDFTRGTASIPINGLIWMGDPAFMSKQISAKLDAGYRCLKLKIGSLDFTTECSILKELRSRFQEDDLEIRVDANGAFNAAEALDKLAKLSQFKLHSIEQPIMPGQFEHMAALCRESPLPIALDEELIYTGPGEKKSLLDSLQPQYIILKPSLLGGFAQAEEWIATAEAAGIGWWVTSALESTIGLNAIAQWAATLDSKMPQGLGTGQIYSNNISAPLYLDGDKLCYNPDKGWNYRSLPEFTAGRAA